jgi:hypothetical protein
MILTYFVNSYYFDFTKKITNFKLQTSNFKLQTSKMATFFNVPIPVPICYPSPVSFTPEGFIVMSDGYIIDAYGMIVGRMEPNYQMLPIPQEQLQMSSSEITSNTINFDMSINYTEPPSFVIGFGSDEIVEKEQVPFNINLGIEHPGVLIAEELLR